MAGQCGLLTTIRWHFLRHSSQSLCTVFCAYLHCLGFALICSRCRDHHTLIASPLLCFSAWSHLTEWQAVQVFHLILLLHHSHTARYFLPHNGSLTYGVGHAAADTANVMALTAHLNSLTTEETLFNAAQIHVITEKTVSRISETGSGGSVHFSVHTSFVLVSGAQCALPSGKHGVLLSERICDVTSPPPVYVRLVYVSLCMQWRYWGELPDPDKSSTLSMMQQSTPTCKYCKFILIITKSGF